MVTAPERLIVAIERAVKGVNVKTPAVAKITSDYTPLDGETPDCVGVTVENSEHGRFFGALVNEICDEFGDGPGWDIALQVMNDKRTDVRPGRSVTYFPGLTYAKGTVSA